MGLLCFVGLCFTGSTSAWDPELILEAGCLGPESSLQTKQHRFFLFVLFTAVNGFRGFSLRLCVENNTYVLCFFWLDLAYLLPAFGQIEGQ